MLIIDNKKYATTEQEQVDSLFTSGGSLDFIQNKKRKNETLFFSDKEKTRGFFSCPATGVCGQFSTLKNGKLFFQFTTSKVVHSENGKIIAKS